jgi:hypothetical protein
VTHGCRSPPARGAGPATVGGQPCVARTRRSDRVAAGRRPGHPVADVARPGRIGREDRRAGAAARRPSGLGGTSARQTRRAGRMGRRPVVERRAVLAEVDLDDRHDVGAARHRTAASQPRGSHRRMLLDQGLQPDGGSTTDGAAAARRASPGWCCPSSRSSSTRTTGSTRLPITDVVGSAGLTMAIGRTRKPITAPRAAVGTPPSPRRCARAARRRPPPGGSTSCPRAPGPSRPRCTCPAWR